jgi:hypothetical protein
MKIQKKLYFFQVHHNNYKTGSAIFVWVVAGAKKEIISLLSVQKKSSFKYQSTLFSMTHFAQLKASKVAALF